MIRFLQLPCLFHFTNIRSPLIQVLEQTFLNKLLGTFNCWRINIILLVLLFHSLSAEELYSHHEFDTDSNGEVSFEEAKVGNWLNFNAVSAFCAHFPDTTVNKGSVMGSLDGQNVHHNWHMIFVLKSKSTTCYIHKGCLLFLQIEVTWGCCHFR